MTPAEKCATCRFWSGDDDYGQHRRLGICQAELPPWVPDFTRGKSDCREVSSDDSCAMHRTVEAQS